MCVHFMYMFQCHRQQSSFQRGFVTLHTVSWKKALSTTEDPNNRNANISMLTRSQSNANGSPKKKSE